MTIVHKNTQAHTHAYKGAHALTYSTTHPLVLHCFPRPLTQADNASLDFSQLSSFNTPGNSMGTTEGTCMAASIDRIFH